MTAEAYRILLGAGVVVILMVASCALRAEGNPKYYDEQLLNYRFSEFCSVVGKPPLQLAEAINGAIAQDPATWVSIAAWWNKIKEHYEKAGCGNA